MTALIIEDEEKGRINLRNHLEKHCPHVQIIAEAESIQEGLEKINSPGFEVDLAFLDIDLPDGLVFSMLNQLDHIPFDIIFVTAFEKFAIQAFKYSAIDFITKPIDYEALIDAVNRVRPREQRNTKGRMDVLNESYGNSPNLDRISISTDKGYYVVSLKDITRLEGMDNYTVIYFASGEKVTSSKTLKLFEDLLSQKHFFRVHKKYVINLNFIQRYMKGDNAHIIMNDGEVIEISRRRRPMFMEILKKMNLEI
jgi:two-component system, LytTR family, response regulator